MASRFRRSSSRESGSSNLGLLGERYAIGFLKSKGLRIVEHSHRQRLGEIDIIAMDGDCLVFVEVKTWRMQDDSPDAGDPSEAVTLSKQRKLSRAALVYLKQHQLMSTPTRFDVISIWWPVGGKPEQPRLRHFKHAFEPTGRGQFYG
ncbi:MAG: YraN family protein [Planctomycetales bacterium]|nr:YraN family protein [Planctomycetales bacterium]